MKSRLYSLLEQGVLKKVKKVIITYSILFTDSDTMPYFALYGIQDGVTKPVLMSNLEQLPKSTCGLYSHNVYVINISPFKNITSVFWEIFNATNLRYPIILRDIEIITEAGELPIGNASIAGTIDCGMRDDIRLFPVYYGAINSDARVSYLQTIYRATTYSSEVGTNLKSAYEDACYETFLVAMHENFDGQSFQSYIKAQNPEYVTIGYFFRHDSVSNIASTSKEYGFQSYLCQLRISSSVDNNRIYIGYSHNTSATFVNLGTISLSVDVEDNIPSTVYFVSATYSRPYATDSTHSYYNVVIRLYDITHNKFYKQTLTNSNIGTQTPVQLTSWSSARYGYEGQYKLKECIIYGQERISSYIYDYNPSPEIKTGPEISLGALCIVTGSMTDDKFKWLLLGYNSMLDSDNEFILDMRMTSDSLLDSEGNTIYTINDPTEDIEVVEFEIDDIDVSNPIT